MSSARRLAAVALLPGLAVAQLPSSPSSPAAVPLGSPDSSAVRALGPGLEYRVLRLARGPWELHLLRVDLAHAEVLVRHAGDSVRSRETVSAMAARLARTRTVIAGLNADFFDLRTGEVENNQVIDGAVWKAVPVTDSPHDTFRNIHGQALVTPDGRVRLGRFAHRGELAVGGTRFRLDGINGLPRQPSALIHFDGRWGTLPVSDSTRRDVAQATVRGVRLVGYGVGGRARLDSVARASQRRWLPDRPVRVRSSFVETSPSPPTSSRPPSPVAPLQLVGGWPMLIQSGRSIAERADSLEGTFPRFSGQRHPRSALATSDSGRALWLVAVDGRQAHSVGMTLAELAEVLRTVGIDDALNLDGGGSTTFWLQGAVRNRPSDPTGERPVGNALFIVQRPRR